MAQFRELEDRLPRVRKTGEQWELDMLWDVVVNVYVRSLASGARRVGYLRYRALDVWGFSHSPEWHPVKPVVQRNGRVEAHAGFLLFNLCFGPKRGVEKPPPRPPMERLKVRASPPPAAAAAAGQQHHGW